MTTQANPVNWFEIPATNLDRARKFYEQVLGLTLHPMEMGPASMAMFPMMPEAAGAGGALIKTEGYIPSHEGTVVYLSVPDIEATLGLIGQHGGKTLVPKMSIGEFGFIAQFEDCEGNRVALHAMS